MSDDFIRSLQGDWQSRDQDVSAALRRLRQTRWVPHLVLGAEVIGCAIALLVGIWFAWVAAHNEEHTLLFTLSAAIMLLAAPALCIASVVARRESLAWHAETPESILNVGIRRVESSLTAIRIGRWHVAIVALFVVALWLLQSIGLINAMKFLTFYTSVCLAISLTAWAWMRWREKRLRSERAALHRLLAALEVEA